MADQRERRSAVTELLRQFFASLTTQLSTSTAEIWSKVEQRLSHKPSATTHSEDGHRPPREDMQPQATQQQQQHKKTDDA
jgi:hypothetical protein